MWFLITGDPASDDYKKDSEALCGKWSGSAAIYADEFN